MLSWNKGNAQSGELAAQETKVALLYSKLFESLHADWDTTMAYSEKFSNQFTSFRFDRMMNVEAGVFQSPHRTLRVIAGNVPAQFADAEDEPGERHFQKNGLIADLGIERGDVQAGVEIAMRSR